MPSGLGTPGPRLPVADIRKTRRLDSAPTRACISVPCIAGSRHGLIHPLYLPTCALVCVPERAGRPGIPRPIRDPMRLCDDPKAATTGTSGFRIRTGLRDEKNRGSPILALVPEAGREVQSMSSTPGNVRDVAIARRNLRHSFYSQSAKISPLGRIPPPYRTRRLPSSRPLSRVTVVRPRNHWSWPTNPLPSQSPLPCTQHPSFQIPVELFV